MLCYAYPPPGGAWHLLVRLGRGVRRPVEPPPCRTPASGGGGGSYVVSLCRVVTSSRRRYGGVWKEGAREAWGSIKFANGDRCASPRPHASPPPHAPPGRVTPRPRTPSPSTLPRWLPSQVRGRLRGPHAAGARHLLVRPAPEPSTASHRCGTRRCRCICRCIIVSGTRAATCTRASAAPTPVTAPA